MIKSYLINKYLGKEFFKIILNTTVIFFCLGFIMNLFEEINFFKDYDVTIIVPIKLTLLFVPNLINNYFPFVILLSGMWFFLKIKKTDELTAINIAGRSNFSIILVPSFLAIILGIFFVTTLSPITSELIKRYEKIKGNYELDKEYLAAITENGIWIKERKLENNYIIRSANIENNKLMGITIYEFDKDDNFNRRIEAESANIDSLSWILYNVRIIDKDGAVLSSNVKNITYNSIYNLDKIQSLYSNLDTISFWNLDEEIKLLRDRGYSTKEMQVKLHKSFAFPFFLLSMVLLSSLFTIGTKKSESNWTYVFITIISSILIFFFNDFSAALGKTEKLPLHLSVWMPIIIIFIFSSIGLINANQK
jgi:lipopolysaccharide export system permease protein|tara:strand:+ start:152 stop:1243 length:1092 start_codon:yes stop_codon:yes gene_type:complete